MINSSFITTLPDTWAINRKFIMLAVNRWNDNYERVLLGGLTCDSDDYYNSEQHTNAIYLPKFSTEKPLYLGFFHTGAYQETLGDLHNLLGDTNVVGVHLENGRPVYTHEVEGDTVSDVLSYVEYDPKELVSKVRNFAEKAVSQGRISPRERREIRDLYRAGLSG